MPMPNSTAQATDTPTHPAASPVPTRCGTRLTRRSRTSSTASPPRVATQPHHGTGSVSALAGTPLVRTDMVHLRFRALPATGGLFRPTGPTAPGRPHGRVRDDDTVAKEYS